MSERTVELEKVRGHLEDVLREVAQSHQPMRVLLDGGAVVEVRSLKRRKRADAAGYEPASAAEDPAKSSDICTSTVTLEEEIASIARSVPDVEWKSLPGDLSDNLDHYIYGTPRRS